MVADEQLTILEYAGEFSRGALCGDKTDVWGFCDSQTIAYLAGGLAAGFVGIGDIRDALANVADGNFVSAAASVAFIIRWSATAPRWLPRSSSTWTSSAGLRSEPRCGGC